MKAMTTSDTCYSTIEGHLSSVFNTDGVSRTVIDPLEARQAFDFKIVKKQSFDEHQRPIPGHYHLRREDTDAIIPSTGLGEKFQPVQHLSIYDYIVNDILPKIPGMKLETVGTLHGGGTGLVMSTIGDHFAIKGDDSPNDMRLIFSNPCNGMGSLVLGITTVRLFCQNQIAAARRQAGREGFAVQHTKNAEVYVGGAIKSIQCQIRQAEEIRRKSEMMAETDISSDFIMRMLNRIYPYRYEKGTPGYTRNENIRSEVLTQFDGGETAMSIKGSTAWKLFNAFSFPIFNPRSLGNRMDLAEIAYTGAVGSRADKVTHIFNAIFDESYRRVA